MISRILSLFKGFFLIVLEYLEGFFFKFKAWISKNFNAIRGILVLFLTFYIYFGMWPLASFGLMGLSGSGTPPGSPGKTRSPRCTAFFYYNSILSKSFWSTSGEKRNETHWSNNPFWSFTPIMKWLLPQCVDFSEVSYRLQFTMGKVTKSVISIVWHHLENTFAHCVCCKRISLFCQY